jgi:hypothetical protein
MMSENGTAEVPPGEADSIFGAIFSILENPERKTLYRPDAFISPSL